MKDLIQAGMIVLAQFLYNAAPDKKKDKPPAPDAAAKKPAPKIGK